MGKEICLRVKGRVKDVKSVSLRENDCHEKKLTWGLWTRCAGQEAKCLLALAGLALTNIQLPLSWAPGSPSTAVGESFLHTASFPEVSLSYALRPKARTRCSKGNKRCVLSNNVKICNCDRGERSTFHSWERLISHLHWKCKLLPEYPASLEAHTFLHLLSVSSLSCLYFINSQTQALPQYLWENARTQIGWIRDDMSGIPWFLHAGISYPTQYLIRLPVTTKGWYYLQICLLAHALGPLLCWIHNPSTHYISSLPTERQALLGISVQVCLLCKYLPLPDFAYLRPRWTYLSFYPYHWSHDLKRVVLSVYLWT